jgi:four helix bundle protein
MSIQSYQDLEIWQKAMKLAEKIYALTKSYPKEEQFILTSQMRRAAISIPANIAEGWARQGTIEFLQFLRIAMGSLRELETLIILSRRVYLIPVKVEQEILSAIETLSRMLLGLQRSLKAK